MGIDFGKLIHTTEIQAKLNLSEKLKQHCVWSTSQHERMSACFKGNVQVTSFI